MLGIVLKGGIFYFQYYRDKLYLIFANGLKVNPVVKSVQAFNENANIFKQYGKF